MRKHLAVFLVITAITLVVGFGAANTSIPTPIDEVIYPITIEQTEPFEPIEPMEPVEPIEILSSNKLTVYQDDGYLHIKSVAMGTNYLIQLKSLDGHIEYGYIPYSTNFQTVPLPDTDKVTLALLEKAEGNFYKPLSSIEFRVDIKDKLKRYIMPNVFVYYDSSSLSTLTAKKRRASSNSDLDFIIKAFKMVYELPYDYEKYGNIEKLPDFYIPNVDDVLTSGTGICSDKATLLASLLRSQGIPTKYVTGEVAGNAHAWNEVYIDNT